MWWWRKRQDFKAEIEAHLQLEADELHSEGLSSAEAQAAAQRVFGNRTSAEERFYESSHWMFGQHFVRDLRFAARMLVKDAKFSVLGVLALGIGIGVSTGIFALLGPMFQPHGSNVRSIEEVRNPASYVGLDRGRFRNFSFPEYRYFQDHSSALEEISAESAPYNVVLNAISEGGDAEQAVAAFESAGSMSVLGMQPALGRSFSKEEEQPGAPLVAILSNQFWRRRFGGDAGVLGKTIVLNAHVVRIVGVADPKFHADDASAIFLPLGLQPLVTGQGDWLRDSQTKWLMASARLRRGVSMTQAQAETYVLGAGFDGNGNPGTAQSTEDRVMVSPGGGDLQTALMAGAAKTVINVIVAMILMIACSNLANLLLARAAIRQREIGVRLSLGASRSRLVCQLLTESLLLSMGGGAVGLVFSVWLIRAISWLSPALVNLPSGAEVHLGQGALLYALVLSLATGFAFGLGPALAATKTNVARALHADGLSGTPSTPSHKMWSPRNLLVVAPLSVSLMLLIGATGLARALQNARTEPKFDASRVIGVTFRLKAQGYDESKSLQFQNTLRQRITTIPGVVSVALASGFPLPWLPPFGRCALSIDGSEISAGAAVCHAVSAGYFETLALPIVRGRAFSPSDRAGSEPAAIVNQELARTYWPGQEPIGKRIRGGDTFFEVVGVAANVQDAHGHFSFLLLPTIYVPAAQGNLLSRSSDSGGDRAASYQL
jgi:predicted permease